MVKNKLQHFIQVVENVVEFSQNFIKFVEFSVEFSVESREEKIK